MTPPLFLLTRALSQRAKPLFLGIRNSLAAMNSMVEENIEGNRVVKAFVREEHETGKFDERNADYMDRNMAMAENTRRFMPWLDGLGFSLQLITIGLGGLLVLQGNMTLGGLVAFSSCLWMIDSPERQPGWLVNDWQRFNASCVKIRHLLTSQPRIREESPERATEPRHVRGAIHFDHVSFAFPDDPGTPVLDDIDFTVPTGARLGILGETGAGKTTLALTLMRLLPERTGKVTSGSINFEGENIVELPEAHMRKIRGDKIAMIFQEPMTSFSSLYTIGNQLCEAIAASDPSMGRRERYARAVEMLRLVNVNEPEKRMKQYPHELSGGMRQRVMIAMGLICHPKLLIADEPTTALDVTIQAQILELMKELQKKTHMGIIFITHNLGVVAEICDKVCVMYAGKMVEQGPVDDIFYSPAHPYTEGLLRSMPRVDADNHERLIPIEGTPVDMLNPPEGCPFAPRCDAAMKICIKQRCENMQLNGDHRAACWMNVKRGVEDGSIKLDGEGGEDHE